VITIHQKTMKWFDVKLLKMFFQSFKNDSKIVISITNFHEKIKRNLMELLCLMRKFDCNCLMFFYWRITMQICPLQSNRAGDIVHPENLLKELFLADHQPLS